MLLAPLFLLSVSLPRYISSAVSPKIAIIGGGIGGTSCAYFLNELFQNKAAISLFEKDEIGGRLSLIDVDGNKYEAGGSVIHPRNEYMVKFSKVLELGMRQPQSSTVGIYSGEKFVFKESDWYIYTIASLIWNYGLSILRLDRDVKSMLDDFSKIYSLQEKGYAFTSVDKLLNSMNPAFTNMTRDTIASVLRDKGFSGRFVNEYVQSIMMVNYGMTNNISGFAGYVSLSGADPNLWSVEGGNKLVPEGLLKKSKSEFIKANVLEITLLPEENYSVTYQENLSNEPVKTKNFDIVILCVPLIKGKNNIKFVNFPKNFQQFERPFLQIVSTFVRGTINPSAFNENSVPDDILTYNDSLIFNSIGKNSPVVNVKNVGSKNVYKIFSEEPLSEDSVKKLFNNFDIVKEKVWLAYPHYNPPEEFAPFILHPGLYYTNAIELSASAMEMSAVSAKNIALLIFNYWKNTIHNIDPYKSILKDEL